MRPGLSYYEKETKVLQEKKATEKISLINIETKYWNEKYSISIVNLMFSRVKSLKNGIFV